VPTLPTPFVVQFSDPELRKYNLVAMDSRGHGRSSSTQIPKTYGPEQAAEDVARFMEAIQLPPCHIVGLGMGSCIGLYVAHTYPEKVLSLFAISPLSQREVIRDFSLASTETDLLANSCPRMQSEGERYNITTLHSPY
jgi:pimeloyl-ACP methyl ester carboxylesterase